jgi:hypothetical protein
MTMKTKKSLVMKVDNAKKEVEDLRVRIKTEEALAENLRFCERIHQEAESACNTEINAIARKQADLN